MKIEFIETYEKREPCFVERSIGKELSQKELKEVATRFGMKDKETVRVFLEQIPSPVLHEVVYLYRLFQN